MCVCVLSEKSCELSHLQLYNCARGTPANSCWIQSWRIFSFLFFHVMGKSIFLFVYNVDLLPSRNTIPTQSIPQYGTRVVDFVVVWQSVNTLKIKLCLVLIGQVHIFEYMWICVFRSMEKAIAKWDVNKCRIIVWIILFAEQCKASGDRQWE